MADAGEGGPHERALCDEVGDMRDPHKATSDFVWTFATK